MRSIYNIYIFLHIAQTIIRLKIYDQKSNKRRFVVFDFLTYRYHKSVIFYKVNLLKIKCIIAQ